MGGEDKYLWDLIFSSRCSSVSTSNQKQPGSFLKKLQWRSEGDEKICRLGEEERRKGRLGRRGGDRAAEREA
jgi:hypothetical protein